MTPIRDRCFGEVRIIAGKISHSRGTWKYFPSNPFFRVRDSVWTGVGNRVLVKLERTINNEMIYNAVTHGD